VHLEISDSVTVKYTGRGIADADAASVRTNVAVPSHCGLFYYEVKIVSKGRHGYIGVGFCVAEFAPDRLPGWEADSYGYHGDDGNAFNGSGKGQKYGPMYTTGDVIGALWNRIEGTISFYKNGVALGEAFTGVRHEKLYPTVGLRTTGEEVRANFGDRPWMANVGAIQASLSQQLEDQIAAIPLRKPRKPSQVMEELVFGHLQHCGYSQSARLAARDMLGGERQVSPEDVESVRQRQRICDLVMKGDVEGALSAADAVAPGALAGLHTLAFRLHLQAFIEHVRAGRDQEAIQYGVNFLVPFKTSREEEELLTDASTLLGYLDPATSPVGQLLSEQHKAALAADVNRAVLSHQGAQDKSPLERLVRQGMAVCRELKKQGHPVASLIDLHQKSSPTG